MSVQTPKDAAQAELTAKTEWHRFILLAAATL